MLMFHRVSLALYYADIVYSELNKTYRPKYQSNEKFNFMVKFKGSQKLLQLVLN